jgi:hypothetical protein
MACTHSLIAQAAAPTTGNQAHNIPANVFSSLVAFLPSDAAVYKLISANHPAPHNADFNPILNNGFLMVLSALTACHPGTNRDHAVVTATSDVVAPALNAQLFGSTPNLSNDFLSSSSANFAYLSTKSRALSAHIKSNHPAIVFGNI